MDSRCDTSDPGLLCEYANHRQGEAGFEAAICKEVGRSSFRSPSSSVRIADGPCIAVPVLPTNTHEPSLTYRPAGNPSHMSVTSLDEGIHHCVDERASYNPDECINGDFWGPIYDADIGGYWDFGDLDGVGEPTLTFDAEIDLSFTMPPRPVDDGVDISTTDVCEVHKVNLPDKSPNSSETSETSPISLSSGAHHVDTEKPDNLCHTVSIMDKEPQGLELASGFDVHDVYQAAADSRAAFSEMSQLSPPQVEANHDLWTDEYKTESGFEYCLAEMSHFPPPQVEGYSDLWMGNLVAFFNSHREVFHKFVEILVERSMLQPHHLLEPATAADQNNSLAAIETGPIYMMDDAIIAHDSTAVQDASDLVSGKAIERPRSLPGVPEQISFSTGISDLAPIPTDFTIRHSPRAQSGYPISHPFHNKALFQGTKRSPKRRITLSKQSAHDGVKPRFDGAEIRYAAYYRPSYLHDSDKRAVFLGEYPTDIDATNAYNLLATVHERNQAKLLQSPPGIMVESYAEAAKSWEGLHHVDLVAELRLRGRGRLESGQVNYKNIQCRMGPKMIASYYASVSSYVPCTEQGGCKLRNSQKSFSTAEEAAKYADKMSVANEGPEAWTNFALTNYLDDPSTVEKHWIPLSNNFRKNLTSKRRKEVASTSASTIMTRISEV